MQATEWVISSWKKTAKDTGSAIDFLLTGKQPDDISASQKARADFLKSGRGAAHRGTSYVQAEQLGKSLMQEAFGAGISDGKRTADATAACQGFLGDIFRQMQADAAGAGALAGNQ